MGLKIVDYTEEYYKKGAPPERGGKFVQLTDSTRQCLVLSPMELHPFHANIIEAFLLSEGVSGTYNKKRDNYSTKGSGWKVLGGGIWRLSEPESTIRFGGASLAYGPLVSRGLARRIESSGAFKGLKVIVER